MFFVYLSRGLLPVTAFFYHFEDNSFELCIFWLCTSSDVEARFNYPISKKKKEDEFHFTHLAYIKTIITACTFYHTSKKINSILAYIKTIIILHIMATQVEIQDQRIINFTLKQPQEHADPVGT
jgi:hypothetical protein